jgi:hypothetical protein
MHLHINSFPSDDQRKIWFFRVWVGVQNFILIVQNCIKKSTKYCQGLVLLFKSGRAVDTDLYLAYSL